MNRRQVAAFHRKKYQQILNQNSLQPTLDHTDGVILGSSLMPLSQAIDLDASFRANYKQWLSGEVEGRPIHDCWWE